MAFIYILISEKDGKFYIGSTNNIERRLEEHNAGLVKSTKSRRPLALYALQKCDSLVEARLIEKSYKESHGRIERALKKGSLILIGE